MTDKPSTKKPATAPDPFDVESLRLKVGEGADLGVEKALLMVPVRKPSKQEWFRVHPDETHRVDTALIELKDERETYLVAPNMRGVLPGEVLPYRLMTAQNRQGVTFLIPLRLPDDDGRSNPWWDSMAKACDLAMDRWTRVRADMSLGGYQVFHASGEIPAPEWPDKPLGELLRLAFQDGRLIDREDHPVIRRLYGQS